MSEPGVELIRRWVDVANQRDGWQLADFYAEDARYTSPKGVTVGKAALAAAFSESFDTTPDLTTTIVRLFGKADDVALEIVVAGTTARPHPAYPNSSAGRRFENPQVHLFQISGGKILSNVVYYDYARMARQLVGPGG